MLLTKKKTEVVTSSNIWLILFALEILQFKSWIFTSNHVDKFHEDSLAVGPPAIQTEINIKDCKRRRHLIHHQFSSKKKNDHSFVGIRLVLVGLIVLAPYNQTLNTSLNFKLHYQGMIILKTFFFLNKSYWIFTVLLNLLMRQLNSL